MKNNKKLNKNHNQINYNKKMQKQAINKDSWKLWKKLKLILILKSKKFLINRNQNHHVL